MDSETPQGTQTDGRARRVVAIILILMAVFIAVPLILYVLASRGAPPGP
jgi:nitrogen fixation protein FixH